LISRRIYAALEFAVVFIVLPLAYLPFCRSIHPLPVLWCFAAVCAYLLRRNEGSRRHGFWGECPKSKQILYMIGRFVLIAVLLGVFTLLHDRGRFLSFPRFRPLFWSIVMLLYPLLSAVPQGIIYRAFVFSRYKCLFGEGWAMIAASALVFSFAHIIFLNPVAILLTLGGGLLFAHTYLKSASLWFSSLEHALYGDFIFTIGLGYYIYHGSFLR